jgi:hypothetical protein
MALLFACSVVSAEKIQWYSGAFEENKSGKKTTSSNVVDKEGDSSKYVFGFASAKSNMAFAQYPLTPKSGMNAISLEFMSKKDAVNAEIWIESKGWKFQGKIIITEGKFTKIILPLKDCKSDTVKWMRVILPNKSNPKRGMLFLKNPELCKSKITKTRVWHTGVFKNKVKSSCEQSMASDNAVKYSWNFAGVKAGPVSFSTKLRSKEACREFAIDLKNLTDQTATLQLYIETDKGWKFQKKIKVISKEWKNRKFKLLDADSTKTKYFRLILAPKENVMTGEICIKNLKYIK